MLRAGKLFLLRAARALGAAAIAIRTPWRGNRLLILAYHGTSMDDEHEWNPRLYITPSTLRRRLELIRDSGCNVLPLDAALRRLYHGELPPGSVALTVDDGTYDFYREAFPIYQSFGFPVTVYLTTYYAVFNRPVYDTMSSYLLWKARGKQVRWPEVFGTGDAIELAGRGMDAARRRMRDHPDERGLSGAGKDALLCQLAERLGIDYESILQRRLLHIMSLDEARELAARGVDFQLHTHCHRVSLDKESLALDIRRNRECLLRIQSAEPVHFCYPSGVCRREFLPWFREWNIASATTCRLGLASRRSDPLLLPRLLDGGGVTEEEFVGWLSGFAALFPSRPELREGLFEPPAAFRKPPPGSASARGAGR